MTAFPYMLCITLSATPMCVVMPSYEACYNSLVIGRQNVQPVDGVLPTLDCRPAQLHKIPRVNDLVNLEAEYNRAKGD